MKTDIQNSSRLSSMLPRVLLVEDEMAIRELVVDVLGKQNKYQLLVAEDLAEAEAMIGAQKIDLLVADLHLPDGRGMSLLPRLRQNHPSAGAVIITGDNSQHHAVDALRAGVCDFLPKPFTTDMLVDRIDNALKNRQTQTRDQARLEKLRIAFKKLNATRHTISKKVDLLCNDLVGAYGELSRQLDQVRIGENFRKTVTEAADLEQMLCHAMDWILRNAGYCNVAVWLAADDGQFELGAYMKYTIAGEIELTEAMRHGLVPMVSRDAYVHIKPSESKLKLSPAEFVLMANQEIVGVNCTYLGETLATVILFRDGKAPFTNEHEQMLKQISPIFAVALANIVRAAQEGDEDYAADGDDSSLLDEEREEKKDKSKSDADWWKRGEAPPF